MNIVTGPERSRFRQKPTQIVVLILILLAIIYNILAPIFALNWLRQPFLGALFYPRLVVADIFSPHWNARQQGLQTADILLRVDDVPVFSNRELDNLLGQKQVSDTVTLHLERDPTLINAPDTFSVTLSQFTLADSIIFFWLSYVIGLVYLILGLIAYRLRGGEQVGQAFVTFCAFVAMLTGGLFDLYTLNFLTPIWAFAMPLVGASLLSLAFVFPTQSRLIRHYAWVRTIPYVLALILGIVIFYSIYFAADPQAYVNVRLWAFGFIGLMVVLFLALLFDTRLSTFSALTRQQTTILLWGSAISFGPIVTWTIVNALGLSTSFSMAIFAVVFAPFIIFPLTVTYATLRYRLLDLDILFSRGVMYAMLTLLVTLGYFLTVSILGVLLQDTNLYRSPIILVIFVLLLVIFLEPIRDKIQAIVNRYFLRETFDSREVLQRYGRDLISTPLDTDRVLEMLLNQAQQALSAEHAMVFLRDAAQGTFVIRAQTGDKSSPGIEVQFGLSDDLAQWLADTNNILQLTPGGATPANADISREELARLNMLDIALCVPLLGSKYLLGWLALGFERSGRPYLSSDLVFLATLANQTTIALENAQLLEEANRRAAELETLQQISVEIQAEAEPDRLLASVVEHATRRLNAAGGMVFLLEPDGESLKVVVSHNLDKNYTGCIVKTGQDIAGRAMMLGESVTVDNYLSFSGRSPEFAEASFGPVLAVPLHWAGKVRGVLQLVHHPRGLRFSQDDVWLMELFASQSAIALEKSRLLQEARDRANQLAILSEVSVAMSSTLNLDEALQQVMNRAVEILHAEAGSLLLMDPKGQELTFEVVLGPTGKELLGVKTAVGKGIVGTVAQTGKPLIINDVAADPRFNIAFDEATEFRTKDILCVPMIAHEQVVGVIEVINKQDGTVFDEEECNLLMTFGAQAAIVIENAQIFTSTDQALAERIQELQTLQVFDQSLQTSLDLNVVLDMSLTHLMDSLGVSMGLIGVVSNEDEPEPGIYLLAQHGMPTEMGRYRKDPWPLTRGILGRVARTGEIAWINDITRAEYYVPKNHRTRSLLAVPVMREDRVIAVIDLESTDPDYFTSEDVAFVKLLASHAAIAIDNARLFEQVKEANDAKTEFMNIASHELKIPMTSIKGYTKLLQMGGGGMLSAEQQNEFLQIITNSVDRMARLVNDLLDVSRIEAGRIRLEITDVQMADVIKEVIEAVRTQIDKKQQQLTLDVSDDLPRLRADYNRMVQIVTNLVSNAYKYTPEGGTITVTAKPYQNEEWDGVMVTVIDTGYGMSEEDQAQLFTTFFRSADQNIRDEPGTGLGLSITKNMVETHGGELTFESKLGQGSAFTFTLPRICKVPPGVEVVER
ncbi:MAG: GAF domain-containing protein [Anaerolineae bacterium]|nr:GAF domain-containing protein [Anaerolineae bacterium]